MWLWMNVFSVYSSLSETTQCITSLIQVQQISLTALYSSDISWQNTSLILYVNIILFQIFEFKLKLYVCPSLFNFTFFSLCVFESGSQAVHTSIKLKT